MKRIGSFAAAITFVAISAIPAAAKKCPADSVQVGPACVDTYEASVWSTTDAALVKKIQKGKIVDPLDLLGATHHGVGGDNYGAACPDTAAGCTDYYAVSVPGVTPSASITWFQAQAACRNAGKRLATNAEWQAAAYGTPDPGTDNHTTDCNVFSTPNISNTGSRSSCVSDVGAYDMVGNLYEWVADWADKATGCDDWTSGAAVPGNDISCFGGDGAATGENFPGALLRGGRLTMLTGAGVFAVDSTIGPSHWANSIGFRCAR